MKLTTKILLPMCSIILLGMALIAYLAYDMSSENLKKAQLDLKTMAVTNTISELDAVHDFNVLNAISLSQTGLFQEYLSGVPELVAANTDAAIARIVNMRKTYSYAMLGIVDTKGIIMQHTETDMIGKSLSNDYLFTNAMQGNVTTGSPFMFNGKVVYAVSAPVYKVGSQEIMGVVFNVSYLNNEFSKRIPLGDEGAFFVADREGLIFIHSDNNKVFKTNLSSENWSNEILRSKKGSISYTQNDKLKQAYYDEQKDTGWIVVAAVDVEESNKSSLELGKNIFIIATIITIIIVLVTWICVIRMRKNLMGAVNFANEIAAGKLGKEINSKSSDEIGILSNSLDEIARVLKNIIKEYSELEDSIKHGTLLAKIDAKKFEGDFAGLVSGTNAITDSYLTIIDNIPSPVVVLDTDLNAKYVNKIGVDMAGSNYVNKKCRELFAREDDGTANDGLANALRTKTAQKGETKAHPKGGEYDVAYNAIPLLDSKTREVNAMLQLITDITSFKATQRTILHVAEEATQISSLVATASVQLEAQLKTSEESASVQADRTHEANDIMGAMNSAAMEMALVAKEASEVSFSAKQEAENGAGVVKQAVDSIKVVEDQSQKLKDGMEKLHANANAINEVITTISDIADQTNLLALNAAIEAARAGESGRGFAVVADEVRKLAEKTMSSTIQVQNAIIAIQDSVALSVKQVNDSANEVSKTSQLVSETGSVFASIVGMVDETTAKTQRIALSSEEQANHSDSVNHALTEVNSLASQTANSMQESLNAVSELSSQSTALRALIETMK